MGAHPSDPSTVLRGGTATPLPQLIAQDPVGELGPVVLQRYGARLPFLFKVLAAAKPLSLQVHPDKEHAEAAYAARSAVVRPSATTRTTTTSQSCSARCAMASRRSAGSGRCWTPSRCSMIWQHRS